MQRKVFPKLTGVVNNVKSKELTLSTLTSSTLTPPYFSVPYVASMFSLLALRIREGGVLDGGKLVYPKKKIHLSPFDPCLVYPSPT